MKKQNILGESWKNLIVLDACRYDYFKELYRDYLEGKLEKRKSRGSSTGEWLVKTFPDKYDITYFSSNANINSKGIGCFYDNNWKAVDHFSRIKDIWDFGWRKDLRTVPPKEVNKSVLSNNCKKKKIIHYSQPHAAYLSFDHHFRATGTQVKNSSDSFFKNRTRNILIKLGSKFEGIFGKLNSWKMRKLLGLEPRNPFEEVWRRDRKRIERLYRDNLRRVMEKAANLTDKLEGKTIITADHGEGFGKNGIWEHPPGKDASILTTVPWLKVKE